VRASILRRMPKNGGVVMVPFVPSFVSPKVRAHSVAREKVARDAKSAGRDSTAIARELKVWDAAHAAPKATLKDVADQIDYVKRIAGADHVGIGSDFDGVDDDLPVGLGDQLEYSKVFAQLIA